MEPCDAVVVGGGPAGSTAAWALVRAGLDVVLLDRAAFPRDKVCAGWVTPQAVAALELDLEDYAQHRVLQSVTGFNASYVGGPEIETRYDEVVSYGIRRCEFDAYLHRRAGARTRVAALDGLVRAGGEWVVNDSIRTPLVVGAGGHFCPVAKTLGAGAGERPVVVAQEVEFCMSDEEARSCRVRAEVPELFFAPDLEGYGWVFRKGNYLNVGLGRRDPHAFRARVQEFRAFLDRLGRVPFDLRTRWHGHSYLLYDGPGRTVVDDGVVLVGDAAGLAYPQSGEGIGPAIESGLLAAAAIVAADGSYARERLEPYRERLECRFGKRRAAEGTSWLPGAIRAWLGRRVLASPRWNRKLVVERWFLHREQPVLDHAGAPLTWTRPRSGAPLPSAK